jgi:hypothetical protein
VAFLAGILVFQLLCAFPGSVPRTVLRAGLAGSVAAMVAIPFIAMALRGYGDSSRAATRHERGGEAGGRRRVDDARRISGFGKATTDD